MLQNSSEHFSWLKKYPSGTLAQILKEPLLLQKQILIHMKAPSLSSQVPDRQGPGINLGAPFPFSLKSILSRKIGCGTPMHTVIFEIFRSLSVCCRFSCQKLMQQIFS